MIAWTILLYQHGSDFTTFRLFNCFRNIHCYCTSFRVWHQVTWSRTRPDVNKSHHVGCSDNNVEVQPTIVDFRNKVIFTYEVCTSGFASSAFHRCKYKLRGCLPVPFGNTITPRICWSGFFRRCSSCKQLLRSASKFYKVNFFARLQLLYAVDFYYRFFQGSTKLFAFSHLSFSL